jgi:ABC-2 type transport system ATP-binding protein
LEILISGPSKSLLIFGNFLLRNFLNGYQRKIRSGTKSGSKILIAMVPSSSDAKAATPIVKVEQLRKKFGTVDALDGLDLELNAGEIYGLLGPNGAGKSTLIKIIAGLVEPTSGDVRVLGIDNASNAPLVKSKIGYVSENSMLYESLTPRDFFEFVASVRKIDQRIVNERVRRLAPAFALEQFYDSPIGTLSMGTRQKVSIVAALLHEPSLLLLDEPLNGLDAKTSRIVKDLISLHAKRTDSAVLFSTHIMEVAENVCDKIGIIYKGKIIAQGSLDQLRRKATEIALSTNGTAVETESQSGGSATLEEVFLKLTHEEDDIAGTVRALREAFYDV